MDIDQMDFWISIMLIVMTVMCGSFAIWISIINYLDDRRHERILKALRARK